MNLSRGLTAVAMHVWQVCGFSAPPHDARGMFCSSNTGLLRVWVVGLVWVSAGNGPWARFMSISITGIISRYRIRVGRYPVIYHTAMHIAGTAPRHWNSMFAYVFLGTNRSIPR